MTTPVHSLMEPWKQGLVVGTNGMVVRYCSRRGSVAVFDITQVAEKGSFA
jgi:hypothetical protein